MFLQGKEYLMDRYHSSFFFFFFLCFNVCDFLLLSLSGFFLHTMLVQPLISLSLSSFFSCFGFCLNAKENPQDLNLFPVGHAKV
jgi:hypothetical protein